MERIELSTSRGVMAIIFESTPGGIVICNVPLIGTVTIHYETARAFCVRIVEICDEFAKSRKTKKTKQL